jgi:hypothetical protein
LEFFNQCREVERFPCSLLQVRRNIVVHDRIGKICLLLLADAMQNIDQLMKLRLVKRGNLILE